MQRLLSLRCGVASLLSAPAARLRPSSPQLLLRALSAAPAAPALAALLRQLRESTGAPMVDCKAALVAEGNDIPRAVDWLRKKGLSAVKKAEGRVASQGLIAFAVSEAGDAGALVELNSETDFVARNVLFQSLAQRAAAGALAVLPRALDTVTSEAAGGEGSAAALAGAAALAAAPLPGGLVGGAGVGATPCTTAEGVAGVIAQVRENCVLRRASALGGPGCLVVPYAHNSPGAGLGSIGVLVALRSSGGGGGGAPLPASPALTLLGRRLAMHIAAAAPAYLSRAGVPAAVLERERAVLAEQQGKDVAGKPPAIAQKIMEGKLGKFYSECVLLEQAFALGDGSVKVGKWVEAEARAAGAGSVEVAGFVCFRVGAGGGSGNAPAPA